MHQPNATPGILPGISDTRLTLAAFQQLRGMMSGYEFIKVVVDRELDKIHFINSAAYSFHVDYIAENILRVPIDELRGKIDEFNRQVYLSPDRRFYLGVLSFHKRKDDRFFALETVEIDNMNANMLRYFFAFIAQHIDAAIPLLFKPANHLQESIVAAISPIELPRVYSHELFSTAAYVALHPGNAVGRLRVFNSPEDYRAQAATLSWYDIIVMDKVPDDIPRLAGIISNMHVTPLSHTNVLASGWQIPNSVQVGIIDEITQRKLDGCWVRYEVDIKADRILLEASEPPASEPQKPSWTVQQIRLEEPQTTHTPIVKLGQLRMSDRFRYGTKAANLGEMKNLLKHGSGRILGFYRVPRPPRKHLLPYIAKYLNAPDDADFSKYAWNFLRTGIRIPRGIAIPFSVQQEFLESSPKIQQTIGKLKMALTLNAKEIDPLCVKLQQLILSTRFSDKLRDRIDAQIATHLGGVSHMVVRSSSNAEDLDKFSAAGIYESVNHVATAEKIFDSIKSVWSSLVSPRSVRLRHEVGISLDDAYMGVIIQEQVESEMGGVLVTMNPGNPDTDFRNVYINVSTKSVESVVQGSDLPLQYLYNTVEGGGRTLSLGSHQEDLSPQQKNLLQRLAIVGRLLQSHFSPDYTFSAPVDIEWAAKGDTLYILQLRPYQR